VSQVEASPIFQVEKSSKFQVEESKQEKSSHYENIFQNKSSQKVEQDKTIQPKPELPFKNFCGDLHLLHSCKGKKFLFNLIGNPKLKTIKRYRASDDGNGYEVKDFLNKVADMKDPSISLFKLQNGDIVGCITFA
jgi:hypothetical protein